MPEIEPRKAGADARPLAGEWPSRSAAGAPLLRWRAGGAWQEVPLEPAGAPCLVPAGEHGPVLAALLLEALDRRASAGPAPVELSRAGVTVALAAGGAWPAPPRPPSELIGGGDVPRSAADLARRAARVEWAVAAVEALGPRDAARLRDYPQRRRALAARRRRLERRLVAWDDRSRQRRIRVRRGLAGAVVALPAAALGGAAGWPLLMAAGAAAFFLCATVVAFSRVEPAHWTSERLRAERRLTEVAARADEWDEVAADLAARLGIADPWEAAGRLAALGRDHPVTAPGEGQRRELLAAAERLAAGLDLDPEAIDWQRAWPALEQPTGRGWPSEVAAAVGPMPQAGRLLRVARLLARVTRELPPPWPVVLWEPWSDLAPEERARLLLALARAAAPRPVAAIVGG